VNKLTLIPALIAASLGGAGDDSCCAQVPDARSALETDIPDARIALAVEDEILGGTVTGGGRIEVTSMGGIVTVKGTVDDLLTRKRAIDLAATIKGVRGVIDQLEVLPRRGRSDRRIELDVRQALLRDPATEAHEVDVSVDAGLATLTGTVQSWAEKQLCLEAAYGVPGVLDVVDDLGIKTSAERTDDEIESEVAGRIRNDIWVEDGLLSVEVDQGVVHLRGSVGSLWERNRAERMARVAGVRDVDTDALEVAWWKRSEMRRGRPAEPRSDQAIEEAVELALHLDPRVGPHPPMVDVEDGVAYLRGQVASHAARLAAIRDARNTVGVGRVKEFLVIQPDVEIEDRDLAQDVRGWLLVDPWVGLDPITVGVNRGVVRLSGTVGSHVERRHAEDLAGRVKGVRRVHNHLDVRAPGDDLAGDVEIEQEIESQLFWSPFVAASEIDVSVVDGIATLSGAVESWPEYYAAEKNARDGGARHVINRIRVRHVLPGESEG